MAAIAPTMPVRTLATPVLSIGYHDIGTGPAAVLLHGFPYDIHAYAQTAAILADKGFRVVVPAGSSQHWLQRCPVGAVGYAGVECSRATCSSALSMRF
jgi:pimeloyl-ACP methyl ester carboxylesterase